MKTYLYSIVYALKVLLFFVVTFLILKNDLKAQVIENETIKWFTFQQAVELNKQQPKKVFIDVYTDWCGWCKRMDAATFTHPYIAQYMNKNYYPVKFNAERKDTIVFKGTTFVNPNPEAPRSAHQLAAALLKGKMGYPSVVFLDESMNLINVVPGFQQPLGMEQLLKYHSTNSYTKIPWEEYLKDFVSEIK